MKQFLLLFTVVGITLNVNAQNKKEQDVKAIKSMCGCYEVTFNFAETFEYSGDSTYLPSKSKTESAIEFVQLVEDSENKISMQHLLIVGPPQQQMVIKHWRQDWEFENTSLYEYSHDNKWNYVTLPKDKVKGQWSQKVFQVDDSPRYEGSATWVHVDGKSFWENETSAPLPRREYTKRSDYNVTTRRNRHEITNDGWIHDQDNDKVVRADGKEDIILAKEKGYNTYVKVDDSKCKAGQDFWAKHNEKWVLVRKKWDTVFDRKANLTLHNKVENKTLIKHLSDYDKYLTSEEIDPLIDSYIVE